MIVDSRVRLFPEHGRVYLLLLVSEESRLDLIHSWGRFKLKFRIFGS